jgi:hypothetical protein
MGELPLVLQATSLCRNLGYRLTPERVLRFRTERGSEREKHARNDRVLVVAGKKLIN